MFLRNGRSTSIRTKELLYIGRFVYISKGIVDNLFGFTGNDEAEI